MEKQLTDEEICKILGLYLGQKIIYYNDPHDIRKLMFIETPNTAIRGKEIFKLFLTPLSAITDRDAENLYHLYCGLIGYDYTMDFNDRMSHVKDWLNSTGEHDINRYACLADYARNKGYATKIYITANHWANGKTPIELGIGIDNTKQG